MQFAATRNWLVAAFVAAARQREDSATARLLAIRPTVLVTDNTVAAPAPSLDDYAAKHDPDGFDTEKHLLELFTAHHAGADGAAGATTLRRQLRNAPSGQADGCTRRTRAPGCRGSEA